MDFEIHSKIALECFLFSSVPKAPILINVACAAGSSVPPHDILTSPVTEAQQYYIKNKNITNYNIVQWLFS